jgi:Icc-related predicted phosphoesterase
MKIIAISDTHGQHDYLEVPEGDMLIHAGDVSKMGKTKEITAFLDWFQQLPHPYKIFIAGNHDFFFERATTQEVEEILPENVIYLNDSGITIEGINIWGSPISPFFYNWAFNRHRGEDIKKHWDLIPDSTNILVTHGPVAGVLDKTVHGDSVGCADLKATVELIKPKYFICGHIHEAQGVYKNEGTTYINASMLDERYRLVNSPVMFVF